MSYRRRVLGSGARPGSMLLKQVDHREPACPPGGEERRDNRDDQGQTAAAGQQKTFYVEGRRPSGILKAEDGIRHQQTCGRTGGKAAAAQKQRLHEDHPKELALRQSEGAKNAELPRLVAHDHHEGIGHTKPRDHKDEARQGASAPVTRAAD